ncbi:uncharacterized protein [Labrus bergylta]|uniref:uncharacterized protein n=1 Tax=Labrus bergylta TaxID=56723 RepID=UPI003313DFB5
MTSPFSPYLILTALLGFHCEIITVSKVSVKARGSISIPCLYEPPYRNHVKYLCRGHSWLLCSNEVKTNQTEATWKYSISDDTSQRIFTVTINDLEDYTDDTCYWCAVQLKRKKDDGKRFQLSITKDMPSLYVDHQKITAFERGSVTVMCRYKYLKVTEWCRLGSTCVTKQTGSIGGTTVTINETVPNVYNVTMSGLTTACSGWYWCTNGDFQIPVHIMVHKLASTTTEKITVNTKTARTRRTSTQPSFKPKTTLPKNSIKSPEGGESLQDELESSTTVMIVVALVLLLLLVAAAFFAWWRIRHKTTQPGASDTTMGSDTASDPDLLYSTICHNKRKAAHMKQNRRPEDSMTYSTIVLKDCVQQEIQPTDGSVIYSTVEQDINTWGHKLGSRTRVLQCTGSCSLFCSLSDMAFQISFLFILAGLTGIDSISTVSVVSVKAGDSISIPCLYGAQYKNHVKYLCEGYRWDTCSSKVTTNKPNSNKFSIFDDKKQRTFTVTIKDVTGSDLHYWCAVEIRKGPDVGKYFELSVTKDTPSLYVDHQELRVFEGDPIEINCHHGIPGRNEWCRLDGSCVTKSAGLLNEAIVTIIARSSKYFTVTMSGLRTESSGWYVCVKGDFTMPVHITVTEQPLIISTLGNPATTTVDHSAGPEKFLIPLSLLIPLAIATLITWFLLKRHKNTRAESSATTTAAEVTYSTVTMRSKPSSQAQEEITNSYFKHGSDPGSDVIYSSVVILDQTKG